MSRVNRIDDILSTMTKPELYPVDDFHLNGDLIIVTCAGFEDRSVALLNWAISSNKQISSVILVEYKPILSENKLEELIQICETSSIKYQVIQHDRENQSRGGEEIIKATEGHLGPVIIDISGMSRLLIVQIIVALGRRKTGFRNAFIGYTEAAIYPPSIEEVSEALRNVTYGDDNDVYFLSSGVHDVSIVPELSSVALQGQPIRLILFPSFNPDQFSALRSVIQPSYVSVIHGEPPSDDNKWRQEAISKLNGIPHLLHKEEYNISTLHHSETVDVLLNIYKKYGDLQKLIIAPTGSKMQSVGVGIVRTYLEDLQIAYPTTRLFSNPSDYTHGVMKSFILPLADYTDKMPS